MSILVDKNTKVMVQGITGNEGRKAVKEMLSYGAKVICGVTPGKGGQTVENRPVYNSVKEALQKHPEVNATTIYVPPFAGKAAALEAIENKIPLVNIITEQIPIHDSAKIIAAARKNNVTVVGPSSIGIISPGKSKIGSIGGDSNRAYSAGNIGVISKSGGMASETSLLLKKAGLGQSTVVGIGGDVLAGSTFADILRLFEKDEETKAVVIFGEIGGTYEEDAAELIKEGGFTKPVVAFISGKFAAGLEHVSLGHAGAIVEGSKGTRDNKVKALKEAGVLVAEVHHELVDLVKKVL